ncbi:hypothetical protein BURMUCGD1_6001 [Burkholderia multivorans CGD1]|nr:hypothetical protein BURMUCGD1_6001 [Burkholderia multivorans CGD1]
MHRNCARRVAEDVYTENRLRVQTGASCTAFRAAALCTRGCAERP